MKLFQSPASPFVRMVVMAAHELDLLDRIELEPTATTAYSTPDALKAANPLGKIPCLVLDDGRALYDSRVILRYLDSLAPGRLYPQGDALWPVLTLEALAQGMADCGVNLSYEHRLREPEERSARWVAAQRAKIGRGLDALEAGWTDHLSQGVDAGAISVAAVLGYLDFRRELVGVDRMAGRPKLSAWLDGFAARESFRATIPA